MLTATTLVNTMPTPNAARTISSAGSERCQANASGGQSVGESGEGSEVECFSTYFGVELERLHRRNNPLARDAERERE
jgi:hypothetical protein